MLASKPYPALRHAALDSFDVLIGVINADLEVAIAAIARELVEPPGRRQVRFRAAVRVVRGVIGEEGVVGLEEGVEEGVLRSFVWVVVYD